MEGKIGVRCVAVTCEDNGYIDRVSMTTTIPDSIPPHIAYKIIRGLEIGLPNSYVCNTLTLDCIKRVWCFTLESYEGNIPFDRLYDYMGNGKELDMPSIAL